MPDDAPTIQAAVDAHADTVLIRPSTYDETVILRRAVLLHGLRGPDDARPTVAAISIQPAIDNASIPAFVVEDCHLLQPATIDNNWTQCTITYDDCVLAQGLSDLSEYTTTLAITLQGCTVTGDLHALVDGTLSIEGCNIAGHLTFGVVDAVLRMTNSTIAGPGSGIGIGSNSFRSMTIRHSVVDNYTWGIDVQRSDSTIIEESVIRHCIDTGIIVGGGYVSLMSDSIDACGTGAFIQSGEDIRLTRNVVLRCPNVGLDVNTSQMLIDAEWNSIGHCGVGFMATGYDPTIVISNNTFYDNALSGARSWSSFDYFGSVTLEKNIFFRNGTVGFEWGDSAGTYGLHQPRSVGCNDYYENMLGPVSGGEVGVTDIFVDPQFCDDVLGDVHLRSGSPLIDWGGCGLIGAQGSGCADTMTTGTLVTSFVGTRVENGIRIVWVLKQALWQQVWCERAQTLAGPWLRVSGEYQQIGDSTVVVDRSAGSERVWYRLMAWEDDTGVVIDSLEVPSVRIGFAVGSVSPNPCKERATIAFSLPWAARIDLGLFDIQGRRVVTLAHGLITAGRHTAVVTPGVPAGVYLVVFTYPGGSDLRRLIKLD